jgi:tight adherence protein C
MMDDQLFIGVALLFGAIILAFIVVVLIGRNMAARTMEQRVAAIARMRSPHLIEQEAPLGPLTKLFQSVGEGIRGWKLYSDKDIIALESLISSAGLQPSTLLPVLLGVKATLLIGVPTVVLGYCLFAGFETQTVVLVTCFSLPIGMLGPDYMIAAARGPHLTQLKRGIPDALDLLVVCSEAGMGLESALDHVSTEMRHSNAPTAMALSKLLDDLRVLPDRKDALANFSNRTGVDGARRVATMLGQSIKYGTPLSQALRTVALDLRRERMTALEGKAATLPVKLTMPLMLFILPALFIVLMGPPVLRMMDTMTK